MKSVLVYFGFVRYNCSGKFSTRRYGRFDSEIGCNTKCHSKSPDRCENKKYILEEIETKEE